MVKLVKYFGEIARHGDINIMVIVVPFESHTIVH